MNRFWISLVALCVAVSASAQYTYQDSYNKDVQTHVMRNTINGRTEIIIPKVNGYTVFKADLHAHTICSDGRVTPGYRVSEAWRDGLDVLAITDHMEYRRYEPRYVEYLNGYFSECVKVKNTTQNASEIKVDLNYSVRWAQETAEKYPVLIIPGAEVTRNSQEVGHYNALFTTDNNVIPDKDPLQSIRNAKAQGCLIQHNHPGERKTTVEMSMFEETVYQEGLIDGVEIMNGQDFYPKIIDRALERGLFMTSNTDIHTITETDYYGPKLGRNMTLILAKEKTLESIREALEAKRTIVYSFDQLAGEESLLKDLFNASVSFTFVSRDNKKGTTTYTVTNSTSLPFIVSTGESNPQWIDPFTTVMLTSRNLKLEIVNMWCGENSHPVVEVKF